MAKPQETTIKLPPATTLKSLAAAKDRLETQVDRAKEGYDEELAVAVEKKHVHKKALAQALKERKMNPGELHVFYAHLDHYRDKLGLLELAESAPPLPMDDEGEEDEGGEEEFKEAAE